MNGEGITLEASSGKPASFDIHNPFVVDLGNPGQRTDAFRVPVSDINKFSNAFRVLSGSNQKELDALRKRFVPIGQAFETFVDSHRYLQCSGIWRSGSVTLLSHAR